MDELDLGFKISDKKIPLSTIIIIVVIVIVIILIIIFVPNVRKIFGINPGNLKNVLSHNVCRNCIDGNNNNKWCIIRGNKGYCYNKYGFKNLPKNCDGIPTKNCHVKIKKGSTVSNNCELCLSDRDSFKNEWCLAKGGKPGHCMNFFGRDGHPSECNGTKVNNCNKENNRIKYRDR